MATFRVVTNLVARPHTNPLRNRTILLLKLGQFLLDTERFVSAHCAVELEIQTL